MTATELFLASLEGDYDDEAAWEAVRQLRRMNTDEAFHIAVEYVGSADPLRRARALDVLAQLGAGKPIAERPHFDECVAIACRYVFDTDSRVAGSAAWALAHLGSETALATLLTIRKMPSAEIRRAVAVGLAGHGIPGAIGDLIDLMKDDSAEVRDWATFGLGTLFLPNSETFGSLDTPEIRAALRGRLSDPTAEVRDEAVWGLARRLDQQGLQILLDRLDTEEWTAGDEMVAAEVLGRGRDLPVEELRSGLRALLMSA